MMKRIISLVLCLGMIAGTLLMAGCGESTTTTTSDDALPMTLNFVGITEKSTTDEAIEATEEALNRIFKTQFKTKINLTLVTADQYIDLIEERVAEAVSAATRLSAIAKYNSMAQKIANKASQSDSNDNKGLFSKWTQSAKTVEASTISTGTVYTAEQTTVYSDGKIETVYPTATSPIDILMIDGKEMYDYLDEKGYLLSIANALETEFTKFKQYIYPTYFDQLQTITGDIKAIPNNNLLAEYTYLVVDKELADKYDFDVDAVETYADLDKDGAGFLSEIAANESVTPLATEPDALGIYTYFDGDVAVGAYCDPIYGYDPAEGTDFSIRNLFDIPEYTDHLLLMETYRNNGYLTAKSDEFAVNVVKGDASLAAEYADDYYVKVLQNPFVDMSAIFDGMLAVSSYTSDEDRALQILQAINTDEEVKNILQYGIMYDGDNEDVANYNLIETETEDGVFYSVERRNDTYMMDNRLTGNAYMAYPEAGQNVDIWSYYKQTNLDSALAPFMYFYVGSKDLDSMLPEILRRACLTEVFLPIGIDYDDYQFQTGQGNMTGDNMSREFKAAYREFFIECLDKEGTVATTPLNFVTKGTASELDNDFIEFVLSAQGQAILTSIGYTAADKYADDYEVKASMSGTISLMPNTGTSLLSYVQSVMTELSEAYKAMYPDVEFVLYERDINAGYNGNLQNLDGSKYTIGISNRELTVTEQGKNLNVYNAAKSYLEVFETLKHDVYNVAWYENKMITKITNEKYADIISASDLDTLVSNKLGALCGINLQRYPIATRPAGESIVLANAKKNASSYYTNIEYLRVMTEELLFDAAEVAQFASLKDTDFETAVFEYVRKNYETENNLSEEDYVKRVQDFMASVLEYTSAEDKSTKYTVSWDEFQETKVNAQVYIEAATKIKSAYYDKLVDEITEGLLKLYTLPEIVEAVYDIMYKEYLTANGLTQADFENSIKDIYLGEVGSSAEEFNTYAKNSDEYKNVCNNLRKEYKKLLISLVGKTVYDKGESGLSNSEMVETLFDYFLEEELQINDKICELAGIDYDTFAEAEVHMSNYDMYLSTMKTIFVYTLLTQYTQTQIDNWTYEEAETNIYNVLYETGFYTNELAKYIGLELSDYMLAKSNATTYQTYLATLVNALAPELQAKGYNTADFVKESGDLIEEVCYDIILEKFYSEKISINDVVVEASEKYVQGIESATDLAAYLAEAKEATNNNYFYMAVINSLESAWEEAKSN